LKIGISILVNAILELDDRCQRQNLGQYDKIQTKTKDHIRTGYDFLLNER